ncbi:hypothetical protein BsWGS_13191 [Bradybaena similaris]
MFSWKSWSTTHPIQQIPKSRETSLFYLRDSRTPDPVMYFLTPATTTKSQSTDNSTCFCFTFFSYRFSRTQRSITSTKCSATQCHRNEHETFPPPLTPTCFSKAELIFAFQIPVYRPMVTAGGG